MASANFITDYSNWMSNLPSNQPIHTFSIPGSHNSFTYSLSQQSEIAPDEPEFECFNKLPLLGPMCKHIIYNWSVTQNKTCKEQLENGIRYFDFRVAPNPKTNLISLVHGLCGFLVQDSLQPIKKFLENHKKEIVFLDFQHFYKLTSENHTFIIDTIRKTFGSTLVPVKDKIEELTLSYLWEYNYQVFVFYRCDKCPNDFWSGDFIPNPWPNTDDGSKLLEFLQANYEKGRPSNKFYVTQGILTPSKSFVMEHLLSNLKVCLGDEGNLLLHAWIQDKVSGVEGLNIVMSDFVGSYVDLIDNIISLNFK